VREQIKNPSRLIVRKPTESQNRKHRHYSEKLNHPYHQSWKTTLAMCKILYTTDNLRISTLNNVYKFFCDMSLKNLKLRNKT